MLVTSPLDGSATHTQSRTLIPTETTSPTNVKSTFNTDKVTAPPPIMED